MTEKRQVTAGIIPRVKTADHNNMPEKNRLAYLWSSREGLNAEGWEELYVLIFNILRHSSPAILSALHESKENYIQDFFLHKVFESTKHHSACPYGPNELRAYFNNYLIDVYRSLSLRATESVEEMAERGCGCEIPQEELAQPDGEFFEYGLSCDEVRQSARRFLLKLDEFSRLYLALHACSDAPEPLYKLAQQYRIPSYHYRAHQLGICRKKGELASDYATTYIGEWLVKDLRIDLDETGTVLAAFKIMCFESLKQYQDNRSFL